MKTVYDNGINYITTIHPGDQKHILEGNIFVIQYLESEKERMLKKYNNKIERLDSFSFKNSLKLLLEYMNNDFLSKDIQDRLVRKHIIRLVNEMMENVL